MNFKKMMALVMLGAMSVSVVGCSSGTEAELSTNTNTSTSSSTETPDTSEEKVQITAWAWDKNFNIISLEKAAAIYEAENPNVEIVITEYAQDDIIQKLNTGLSSGSSAGLPDIVLIEDYRTQTFLQSYPGSFYPLTDYVDTENFAAYKQDFMTLDGELYGVPFDSAAGVLYYRRDMIEQAGYTDEDMQNLTWDKYIEIGKAVKEEVGVDMLTLDPNDMALIRMMAQSAGSWYVEEDGKTPNLAGNEIMAAAMETYKDLVDAGITKTISEWSQFVGAPNNGEVASVPTGCWFTASIMAAEDQSGLWGMAAFPRMADVPESINASNLGGSSWYVLDSANADVAADFLTSTLGANADLYDDLLTSAGVIGTFLPAQTSGAYTQEVAFFGNQQIYADIAEYTEQIPAVNYGLHTYAIEDIMMVEVQKLLAGTDVYTCLDNAQKQAENQIR